MAGVQASVSATPAAGVPGLDYDNGANDCVSWIADVAIPFGVLVVQTVSGHCALPTATGNVTALQSGVAALSHTVRPSATGGYQIGDVVRVKRRGRIWVLTEEAIVVGDVVFARFAPLAGNTQLGAFRKSADTATAVGVPRASWFAAATSGLAIVDLVVPGN